MPPFYHIRLAQKLVHKVEDDKVILDVDDKQVEDLLVALKELIVDLEDTQRAYVAITSRKKRGL